MQQARIRLAIWNHGMIFTCGETINLIRMVSDNYSFWQKCKMRQWEVVKGELFFYSSFPTRPLITFVLMNKEGLPYVIHVFIKHWSMEGEGLLHEILH